MDENTEVKEGKEEVKEEVKQTEPQYSEIELQAMEHGWKPKEEFDESTGKKWRSAEEFMDRKSLFDKIDEQHRKIKDLSKGLNALAEHNKKIEQSAYERALRELRAERKQALEEGDLVKAEEIRDRIDEVKEEQRKQPVPQTNVVNTSFEQWVAQNKWYESDPDMRAYADGYAQQLVGNGVTDPSVALPQIERKVREVFAAKFRNPNKDRAPSLETGKARSKADSFVMTREEEKVMNQLIAAGAPITREDYISQLKKSRGE